MPTKVLCMAVAGAALLLGFSPQEDDRGKDLFERRCSGCHAADLNKEGPSLRGVFGRKAASARGFAYSEAMKKLDQRWDETSLDRWLTDPDSMAPGTDMEFRLADGEERKAVIAYLKILGGKNTPSR